MILVKCDPGRSVRQAFERFQKTHSGSSSDDRWVTLPVRFTHKFSLTLLALAIICGGCRGPEELVTEYGKVAGDHGGTSVNGTGILLGMFRDSGHTVKRYRKISPRLNRFDTIVWIPNQDHCPSQEAIDALENWLDQGYARTLIYVGRDFDAELRYLEFVLASSELQNREEAFRRLNEVKLAQDQRRHGYRIETAEQSCDWFEIEARPRCQGMRLEGYLANGIDTTSAEVELASALIPAREIDESGRRRSATLLKADNTEFAYSIIDSDAPEPDQWDHENKIIIVSNGSFLLNYGLVNRENRKLAGALIDLCQPGSDVVFLESGPAGIIVTDKDAVNHNSWAWIAQPPLCYLVPHFLLWGLLFCFVFFPIFGRPQRLKRNHDASRDSSDNSSFRRHIDAIGKLLQRSDDVAIAIRKIKHYEETIGKESLQKKE